MHLTSDGPPSTLSSLGCWGWGGNHCQSLSCTDRTLSPKEKVTWDRVRTRAQVSDSWSTFSTSVIMMPGGELATEGIHHSIQEGLGYRRSAISCCSWRPRRQQALTATWCRILIHSTNKYIYQALCLVMTKKDKLSGTSQLSEKEVHSNNYLWWR